MYRLQITLRSGETHSFTVSRVPRHWKSWVMDQLPYGTDYYACKWSVRREQ
jgi:hypothetical protein